MRRRSFARAAALGLAVMAFAGGVRAQAPEAPYMKEAVEAFNAYFAQCSERYDYDSDSDRLNRTLGPHEFAPKEREWRACVYKGVEDYLIANSRSPELYREIIDGDRHLTNRLEQKRITRAERSAWVNQKLLDIELKEKENMAAANAGGPTRPAFEAESLPRQIIDNLRSF